MIFLVDVNVILDVLLDRAPHVAASQQVWSVIETGMTEGLAAHAVRKELGIARAGKIASSILQVFGVAAVDGPVIEAALQLPCPDFEDALTACAARFAGCDFVV